MRYINVDAYVIPKHCKYGPRPAEGIVLNPYEWLSIRDHLIREQKEKELAAIQRAKEEAKKEISVNMTQMWDNTLASLKRQGNLKRIERIQKEKQDKIDQYNEIMKRREEKKRAMEEEVKKKITDEMDFSKTIKNAIHYATVQDSWDKEIEFHQTCKKVRETPAKEALLKFKKEAEEFEKEKKDEEVKEREKKVKQRLFLDKQMEEIRRKKEAELEELKLEKQDLINMKIEEDKIKECELYDKINRKNLEIKLRQKTKRQLEYEKNVQLEEEEENEIIRIYTHYDRRFKKERKQREQQYKDAINAHRQVMIDKLSEGLREAAKREMERIEAACLSKEEEMVRQDKRKEKMRQKALNDILDGKREAELNKLREKIDTKEGKKWEMMQVYRSAEINEAWRKAEAEKRRAAKAAVAAGYDMQCKEAREKEAREKEEERLFRVEVDMQEKEEVLKHCQQALDFVKKYNLPEYAVNKAVYNVKREFGLLPQEEPQAASPETTCNKKQLPQGCNCFVNNKMRYFYRSDFYKPKNCIWGPRYQEGLILNEEEWFRLFDYKKKMEREKAEKERIKIRREEIKQKSIEMTSDWENTVKNLRLRSREKRLQEKEKQNEEKIKAHKLALKKQKEQNEKTLIEAIRLLYEDKSTTKQILSGAALSTVIKKKQQPKTNFRLTLD